LSFSKSRLRNRIVTSLRRTAFALLLLLVASIVPVLAAAAGLYTGTAPVNSQSDEDRATALRAALGQVVVKASGDPAALSRPEVIKALGRADRYMQQYSYQPNTGGDPTLPASRFVLVVQFDRTGVDAMLHDLNLGGMSDAASNPVGTDAAAQVAAPGSYRLWFSGLRSAEDYARLVGALNSNEQVRAVRVEQARGNGVQIKVDTRGALSSLLDSLDATRLAHVSNPHPPLEGVDALLDFQP
jgi:Uncharacterized protein conserved in bacteria (DUF2066)